MCTALAYVIRWQAVEFGLNNERSVIKSLFDTVFIFFTQCYTVQYSTV